MNTFANCHRWGFANVALHLNCVGNFTLLAFCCGAVAKFVPILVAVDCVVVGLTLVLLDL